MHIFLIKIFLMEIQNLTIKIYDYPIQCCWYISNFVCYTTIFLHKWRVRYWTSEVPIIICIAPSKHQAEYLSPRFMIYSSPITLNLCLVLWKQISAREIKSWMVICPLRHDEYRLWPHSNSKEAFVFLHIQISVVRVPFHRNLCPPSEISCCRRDRAILWHFCFPVKIDAQFTLTVLDCTVSFKVAKVIYWFCAHCWQTVKFWWIPFASFEDNVKCSDFRNYVYWLSPCRHVIVEKFPRGGFLKVAIFYDFHPGWGDVEAYQLKMSKLDISAGKNWKKT